MKGSNQTQPGKGALDLLEEATHLLRTAPAGTLAAYYAGAFPFVLGGLYFLADMSRSPYAFQHLAGATLGMAGLFVWMKFWQAAFARKLRGLIAGEPLPPFSLRRCGRILATQMALQPTGLLVLPLASLPILPVAWVFAFYQNLTALDDGESGELRGLLRKARQQATLWPRQNHVLLSALLAFGFCVLLNWAMVCFALPGLLKTLLGVESVFTRSSMGMLNTTFFATMIGLTYLCVDPILKAAYALRCFYGESVQSGEDLKAELRGFMAPARALAICLLLTLAATGAWLGTGPAQPRRGDMSIAKRSSGAPSPSGAAWLALELGWAGPLRAFDPTPYAAPLGLETTPRAGSAIDMSPLRGWQMEGERLSRVGVDEQVKSQAGETVEPVGRASESGEPSPKRRVNESRTGETVAGISAPKLDRTIEQVIRGSKYAWRAPREGLLQPADDEGFLYRFLVRVWNLTKGAVKQLFQWLGDFFEWMGKWLGKIFGRFFKLPPPGAPGYGWIMSLNLLLYLLVAGVVLGLLYLGYRIWRNRHPKPGVIASEPIQPLPDVADENVGADQLPEDGWVKLARELLARGELRLALRAFYLASLAHLAERNLLSIAKFKSNRDYERELLRRGHSFPELLAVFGENVTVFDRIWYGLHEVSLELVNEFAARVEQLKATSPAGGEQA